MTDLDKLSRKLQELASNLWWCWNPEATRLFRDLDPQVFHSGGHSARAVLQALDGARYAALAEDARLRARVERVYQDFQAYMSSRDTWAARHAPSLRVRPVAYFSAEFGLHESLPIYSGGLGVLAGDHLKSASDLGVPLVAVGLYYRESYFRQRIDAHGVQHAEYVRASDDMVPAEPARTPQGEPVFVEVPLTHSTIHAQVWQVNVGRNRLLLLDTDIDRNTPEDRQLAARLYFGDSRVRIRQELLLGVGGVRALDAAGIKWGVTHLNEGHSAFASLEQTRLLMGKTGEGFAPCAQEVAQSTVFTTHTPVDAGHDRFPPDLVLEHLEPLRCSLGLSREQFLGLGRVNPEDPKEALCMTVLAFRLSRRANGVSALHGRVTRRNWNVLWPLVREDEVPVGHITNGVHVRSWVAPLMQELYARHIGPDWKEELANPRMWARIRTVSDTELWETHRALKASLVSYVRRSVGEQRRRNGHPEDFVRQAASLLSPETLTIGFARRFATYKRANLLFRDTDRLVRLLTDPDRPVQMIFAGKAHPADHPGQDILRQVCQATLDPRFAGHVVLVEDHDINTERHLVQGVDVWLNTPRRPEEASGTSGQKVLLNGGLNLSILDGWWAEAYDGENGFAIGEGQRHAVTEEQDRRDAEALFQVLENEVVPLYYERDEALVPPAWVSRMKHAIETLGWRFNTDRMVMDYVRECYLSAAGAENLRMP